jgi:hypothetical protein
MRPLRIFRVALCFLGVLAAVPVLAQVDPGMSTVPDCFILSPGPRFAGNPIGGYTVIVRDGSGNPVGGATVIVNFTPQGNSLIAWCNGGPPPFQGQTQADGSITFDMLGGGCIVPGNPNTSCAIPVANVLVSGPPGVGGAFGVAMTCVRSPDVVNVQGVPASCQGTTTCAAGQTNVGLSDAVYHTPAIKQGLVQPCSKFTQPYGAAVNLNDAVVLTPYIKVGTTCGC